DSRCPIYAELAAIFRKTIGLASLLSDALSGLAGKIDMAFVFGSMASGTQKPASDVDVCVVGDISMLDVVKALSPVQTTLGREINPVVMTAEKFAQQSGKRDRFVMRLRTEPKIFVLGHDDDFAKLIADRAT
ncbi:MAG: nucleotidyltransferase domain-containing protein, partial [Lentisphaeria bacterium]|nr:nucleotidyltransferase domain-containing protein [Lentisphaeria bacterium]